MSDDLHFRDRASRLASLLQGTFNDLKRDVPSAAKELNISEETILLALRGDANASGLVRTRVLAVWPVSERDFAVLADDTENGVVLCTSASAEKSARIIKRGGVPYYEYRDTALSKLAPIRPEWIRMLAVTPDLDSESPTLCWNRGHALHQFTYFRGPVDFYYEIDSQRTGLEMNEGDTAFISSYVPHTFSSRSANCDAHVLALTFRARLVGDVREEMAAIGLFVNDGRAIRNVNKSVFSNLLSRRMADGSISTAALSNLSGVPLDQILRLIQGGAQPGVDELARIANALHTPTRELIGEPFDPAARVIIRRASDALRHPYPSPQNPAYFIQTLAKSTITPDAHPVVLTVNAEVAPDDRPELLVGLHQYIYILGPGNAICCWHDNGMNHERVLKVGDSMYLKPGVRHQFGKPAGNGETRILSFRAAGALTGDALIELAMIGREAAMKHAGQQDQWYT